MLAHRLSQPLYILTLSTFRVPGSLIADLRMSDDLKVSFTTSPVVSATSVFSLVLLGLLVMAPFSLHASIRESAELLCSGTVCAALTSA